jgi:hypothetical protein
MKLMTFEQWLSINHPDWEDKAYEDDSDCSICYGEGIQDTSEGEVECSFCYGTGSGYGQKLIYEYNYAIAADKERLRKIGIEI